jgi:Na+-transporting methylmalonyl-CoA/oxaloacetate decarboxylase gamma subunit
MNVLALTIFVGFVLVTLFVLLWFLQAISPSAFSEREALLPFDGEAPAPGKRDTPLRAAAAMECGASSIRSPQAPPANPTLDSTTHA